MTQRWTVEARHNGLGKYRVITGPNQYVVEEKARAQRLEWERRYQQIQEKREQLLSKQRETNWLDAKEEEADRRTAEAENAIQAVKTILQSGLENDCSINWEVLKKVEPFDKPKPPLPIYAEYPREPKPDDGKYQPNLNGDSLRPNGHLIYLSYPGEPQRSSSVVSRK